MDTEKKDMLALILNRVDKNEADLKDLGHTSGVLDKGIALLNSKVGVTEGGVHTGNGLLGLVDKSEKRSLKDITDLLQKVASLKEDWEKSLNKAQDNNKSSLAKIEQDLANKILSIDDKLSNRLESSSMVFYDKIHDQGNLLGQKIDYLKETTESTYDTLREDLVLLRSSKDYYDKMDLPTKLDNQSEKFDVRIVALVNEHKEFYHSTREQLKDLENTMSKIIESQNKVVEVTLAKWGKRVMGWGAGCLTLFAVYSFAIAPQKEKIDEHNYQVKKERLVEDILQDLEKVAEYNKVRDTE